MKKYKAFVFDFDGVIKESVRVKAEAFVELYADAGSNFQKRVEQYHLENGGVSRFQKFKVWNSWLRRPICDDTLNVLAHRFSELVVDKVVDAPYVEGALQAIETGAHHGMCFVATGTPDDEMAEILMRLGLTRHFREVHGSSRKKSVIVKDILDRFNLEPTEVLFIGDAQTDYEAASKWEIDFFLRETDYNVEWFANKPLVTYRDCNLKSLIELTQA